MKTWKMIAGITLCVGLIFNKAEAQMKYSPEKRIEKRVEQMDKLLNLSDKQEADMRKAYTAHAEEMKKLREQRMAKNKEMREAIDAILTPDQKETLKKHHADEHKKRQEDRLTKMKTELNLSDKQVEQLKALGDEHRNVRVKMKDLSEDDRKAASKAERERYQKELKKILTADQLEKMKAMRADHSKRGSHRGR